MNGQSYAGFWIRTMAALIDTILILLVIVPILLKIYGPEYWDLDVLTHGAWDTLLSYILPAVAVIIFWIYRSATPGKMLLGLEIVDAKTGGKPSTAQFVGRYLGYYVSIIPVLLGILWVAFDSRKQGWHDKLAGTVVVRRAPANNHDRVSVRK